MTMHNETFQVTLVGGLLDGLKLGLIDRPEVLRIADRSPDAEGTMWIHFYHLYQWEDGSREYVFKGYVREDVSIK